MEVEKELLEDEEDGRATREGPLLLLGLLGFEAGEEYC